MTIIIRGKWRGAGKNDFRWEVDDDRVDNKDVCPLYYPGKKIIQTFQLRSDFEDFQIYSYSR